jgi:Ca2+ transporting ATPase
MVQNLENVIAEYADASLRTICFGYKDLKPGEGGPTHEDMHKDGVIHEIEATGFTLICILGIRDIIRPEVEGAVEKCRLAGITVRMVTGDNGITAKAIAKECKILTEKQAEHPYACLEGPVFYDMIQGLICKTCKQDSPCNCEPKDVKEAVKNLKVFKEVYKHLRVLARSRPEDKYLLVTGLRQCGNVVAVTGDGTNDAPALKKADVGFAMGITGTDVAKHAADIIITDDNFASIVQAVMWGRNIYDNIRKFL